MSYLTLLFSRYSSTSDSFQRSLRTICTGFGKFGRVLRQTLRVRPSDSEYQTTLTILNTFRSEEDFVGKRILDGWLFC